MNGWTIFYWGWWIAWSPFVGTFIARISKGRTIREVINYSMVAPLTYIILWFSVFGVAGIKMIWSYDNMNKLSGLEHVTDTASGIDCIMYPTEGQEMYTVTANYTWDHKNIGGFSTMACNLKGAGAVDMWFLTLKQFYGLEKFLTVISLAALITYFIASSDSGSLVVDLIAANGKLEASTLQRVIWAFTEGGVAIGLMVAGGGTGTAAVQAMSICCGLPFTVLLCLMCTSMYRQLLEEDEAQYQTKSNTFTFALYEGCFDVIECILSLGHTAFPGGDIWVGLLIGSAAPFLAIHAASTKMRDSSASTIFSTVASAFCFYAWVVCLIYGHVEKNTGMWAVGWALYWCFALIFAETRYRARQFWGISDGNFIEDACACVFLYPQAAAQLGALAKTNPGKKNPGYGDAPAYKAPVKKDYLEEKLSY